MKISLYTFLLFPLFLTSCKHVDSSKQEVEFQTITSSPEGDQKRLDERLAVTNKRWDSLQEILRRKDLDGNYRDSVRNLYFENRYEQEEIYKDFIRKNPVSEVSVSSLNGFKFSWGKEVTQELFKSLDPKIRETVEGKMVDSFIKNYNKPEVGEPYSDFELTDLNNRKIRISEEHQKYTLLEFWTSGCPGWKKERSGLSEAYEKYKNQGFNIVGISGDQSEKTWKNAVEKDSLPWINLRDDRGRESIVQYKYGIRYVPANFLIGPEGKIIAKDVRPEELQEILKNKLG